MFQSTTVIILLILELENECKTWKLGQWWVITLQMVFLHGIYLNKKLPCVVTLDFSRIYLIHKVGRTCKGLSYVCTLKQKCSYVSLGLCMLS